MRMAVNTQIQPNKVSFVSFECEIGDQISLLQIAKWSDLGVLRGEVFPAILCWPFLGRLYK